MVLLAKILERFPVRRFTASFNLHQGILRYTHTCTYTYAHMYKYVYIRIYIFQSKFALGNLVRYHMKTKQKLTVVVSLLWDGGDTPAVLSPSSY